MTELAVGPVDNSHSASSNSPMISNTAADSIVATSTRPPITEPPLKKPRVLARYSTEEAVALAFAESSIE